MKEVIVKMAQRIYTAQEWIDSNPCLLKGEMGVESDTSLFKFGDGETLWRDLPYARTIIDLNVDETSDNPVSSAAVADQLKLKQDKIRTATILLKVSEWKSLNNTESESEDDTIDPLVPYSQTITTLSDVLENERIDLFPSNEVLQTLIEEGIALTAINNNKSVSVIAYNHKPTKDLSIDITLTKI